MRRVARARYTGSISAMEQTPVRLIAPLGFTRAEDVIPDVERPGLLRARTRPLGRTSENALDFRNCTLNNCRVQPEPGLEQAGFETIDLSDFAGLQQVLATVRSQDFLSDSSATALREHLNEARFRLAGGRTLSVEHVADEGMILRRAGPNGLDVNPGGMEGANGHDGARGIHGDQDVYGTPLKQMMKDNAPQLFRHQTVDGRNDEANLFLLNLWIPLQQVTRPLVLMDRRTLDAPRHQLRYGLPVTSFLERDQEQRVNDIWTFLPDEAQAWYFRSDMEPDQAFVFDTLGEPHGSTVLPGEETLAAQYQCLERACEAVDDNDSDALGTALQVRYPDLPESTTTGIRSAADRMTALITEAKREPSALFADQAIWVTQARDAIDAVIRKSIEMRLVATLTVD
jgi:hypothetical protein